MSFRLVHITVLLAAVFLVGSVGSAGEKSLMHCFFYTPISEATEADWDAFYEASDELPGKIDGLHRIWVGKLTERAAVSQQVKLGRTYGACMEFTDEAALATYTTHPSPRRLAQGLRKSAGRWHDDVRHLGPVARLGVESLLREPREESNRLFPHPGTAQ